MQAAFVHFPRKRNREVFEEQISKFSRDSKDLIGRFESKWSSRLKEVVSTLFYLHIIKISSLFISYIDLSQTLLIIVKLPELSKGGQSVDVLTTQHLFGFTYVCMFEGVRGGALICRGGQRVCREGTRREFGEVRGRSTATAADPGERRTLHRHRAAQDQDGGIVCI